MTTRQLLLTYQLIKTTRRLTFDILYQSPHVTYMGEDDGAYFKFIASNGYEVISRSRMDIQTERIWLLGAKCEDESRSGTMVFSSDEKRDAAYDAFTVALNEWAEFNSGRADNVAQELRIQKRYLATAQELNRALIGMLGNVVSNPAQGIAPAKDWLQSIGAHVEPQPGCLDIETVYANSARYCWLRDASWDQGTHPDVYYASIDYTEHMDRAIDVAIEEERA